MLKRNDIYLQMSDQRYNNQDAEAKQVLSLQQQLGQSIKKIEVARHDASYDKIDKAKEGN